MKVTRVEQQAIHKNNRIWDVVDRCCLYSKNVYNEANYLVRQEFIKNEAPVLKDYGHEKFVKSCE